MKILKQSKNFVTREIRISDSKIYYKISKLGSENEADIPFENIEGEKISQKQSYLALLSFSIIIYVFAIIVIIDQLNGGKVEQEAGIIWTSLASCFMIAYFITKQEFWKIKLSNNMNMYIHKNIPNRKVVNEFIENLLLNRNEYLKENYGILDENLNYENQLNNLSNKTKIIRHS